MCGDGKEAYRDTSKTPPPKSAEELYEMVQKFRNKISTGTDFQEDHIR